MQDKIKELKALYEQNLIPEYMYRESLNQYLDELVKEKQPHTYSEIPAKVTVSDGQLKKFSADFESFTIADFSVDSKSFTAADFSAYPDIGSILRERYKLLKIAGCGGVGIVYKALDKQASEAEGKNIYCAIKILPPILKDDQQVIKSLKCEAGLSKQLSHDNIVNVYDFDSDGQWIWLHMEWLEGSSLASQLVIRRDKGHFFTEQEVLALLPPLISALSYAHQRNIIHRDVKPANIFQCTDGRIVLLDFGIARNLNNMMSKLTQDQPRSGTYEYMPPEAFFGTHKTTAADDIYGLGITLYELLSGACPYIGPNVSNRSVEIEKQLEKPGDLNDKRWGVLKKIISTDIEQRPDSVEEFEKQLVVQVKKKKLLQNKVPNKKINKIKNNKLYIEKIREYIQKGQDGEVIYHFFMISVFFSVSIVLITPLEGLFDKLNISFFEYPDSDWIRNYNERGSGKITALVSSILLLSQYLWRNRKFITHFPMIIGLISISGLIILSVSKIFGGLNIRLFDSFNYGGSGFIMGSILAIPFFTQYLWRHRKSITHLGMIIGLVAISGVIIFSVTVIFANLDISFIGEYNDEETGFIMGSILAIPFFSQYLWRYRKSIGHLSMIISLIAISGVIISSIMMVFDKLSL